MQSCATGPTPSQPPATGGRVGRLYPVMNHVLFSLYKRSPRVGTSAASRQPGTGTLPPAEAAGAPTKPRGLLAPWLMWVGSQGSVTPAIKKGTVGHCKAEERRSPVQKPSLRAGLVTQVRGLLALKGKRPCPIGLPPLLGMGSLTPTPGGSWHCFAIIRTFSGRGGRAAISFRSAS